MIPFVEELLSGKVKQVGSPEAKNLMERNWESAIFKESVSEKIWLTKTGLQGDEVADTKNHGGLEKAVFAYPTKHYEYWKKDLNVETINIGGMGENLAVRDMDEDTVCIGDTYQFGDTVIQVSQPRQPCWKPARRFQTIDFALRIQKTGKTGWYFRVIKEGYVQNNLELLLVERPYPQWTISKCNEVMHEKKDDLILADELASCPYLADSWKQTLHKRVNGEKSTLEKRVYGPNI